MADGYILLYRQIIENEFWKEKPFTRGQAWVDLLMKANFKDAKTIIKGQVVTIKRGQVLRAESSLAEDWGWSRGKVRRFLKQLVDAGMITKNGTASGTAITIVKYAFFQDWRPADGTTDGTADGTADGTREKECKRKKKKGEPPGGGRLDWIDEL